MRKGAFAISVAVHAALAVAAMWRGGWGTPPPPETGPSTRAKLYIPPPGDAWQPKRPAPATAGAVTAGRKRPGAPAGLDSIELVVHDQWVADLPAVLARWHGRITNCPALKDGAYRFWLYDPPATLNLGSEAGAREGMPCADFPAGFESALSSKIASEAARRGLRGRVRKVVIGFSRKDAEGLLVLALRR